MYREKVKKQNILIVSGAGFLLLPYLLGFNFGYWLHPDGLYFYFWFLLCFSLPFLFRKRRTEIRSLWFTGQIKECPRCESDEIRFENHYEGICSYCSYRSNLEEFAKGDKAVKISRPNLWEQNIPNKGEPFWVKIPSKYTSLHDETLLHWMSKPLRQRFLGSRIDEKGSREFLFSRDSNKDDEREVIDSICRSIDNIGK